MVTSDTAILQALVEGPNYGLELIDLIAERTNRRVLLHIGNIYRKLRALEAEGFVKECPLPPGDATGPVGGASVTGGSTHYKGGLRGRPPLYYELTALGLREAKANREAAAGLFGFEPRTT